MLLKRRLDFASLLISAKFGDFLILSAKLRVSLSSPQSIYVLDESVRRSLTIC